MKLAIDRIKHNLPEKIIEKISENLQQKGYIIECDPFMPGVQGLLYAHSPVAFHLGFAKVEDHFLFLDWENAIFSRQDLLVSANQSFSKFFNQKFTIPHSLRLRIPNLAVITISQTEFPEETIRFAQTTFFIPWYGGETGQIMLINLEKKTIYYLELIRFRQTGSLPLSHTLDVLLHPCQKSM